MAALEALEILYPARLAASEVPVSTPLLDGLDGLVSTMHVKLESAHVYLVRVLRIDTGSNSSNLHV